MGAAFYRTLRCLPLIASGYFLAKIIRVFRWSRTGQAVGPSSLLVRVLNAVFECWLLAEIAFFIYYTHRCEALQAPGNPVRAEPIHSLSARFGFVDLM